MPHRSRPSARHHPRPDVARNRLAVRAVTALAVCLAAVACDSSPQAGPSAPPVTRELALLISSQNGLYYPPFLREEPAGPEDNAYALRIRSLLGETPQLALAPKTASFFRDESLAASPLWGRTWLAGFARAGAPELLTAADAEAVRGMRTPGGWFGEPGAEQPDSREYRAEATAAALDVLRAAGGLTPADRAATTGWLATEAADRPSLREAGSLAQAFRLLDEPVPDGLTALRPPVQDISKLSGDDRYQALLDAYGYAAIPRPPGSPSGLDATTWTHILEHNSNSLDYRDLSYAVAVAQAARVPASAFAAVRARIVDNLLADGTVRDPGAYAGNPEAALYGLRLRVLAGEPTRDPELAAALHRVADQPEVSDDPHARLSTADALHLAEGRPADAGEQELCHQPDVVPAAVVPEESEAWARAALACAELDVHVPLPSATPWPLDDPAHVTAAATLLTGLVDSRTAAGGPAWISADALRDWALNPERLPSVTAYATVVRAYLLAGGQADGRLTEAMARGLDQRRGCPGLPDLYRTDATEAGCDLKATWAVWQLQLRTGGSVPVHAGSPSIGSDRPESRQS
ncbi:hypothetical protein ACGF12_34290 [Kitasatospora sp. NPDC048296]|uniref:hypothetical protein n=1 Tax=Kitasatospora sp. NPDC048296 TaxID=3364048 RepID=UPI00371B501A